LKFELCAFEKGTLVARFTKTARCLNPKCKAVTGTFAFLTLGASY
jgi:hypothetical protein